MVKRPSFGPPCAATPSVAMFSPVDVTCDEFVDLSWFYGTAASIPRATDTGSIPSRESLTLNSSRCRRGSDASPLHASHQRPDIDVAQQCSSAKWLCQVFDTFDENKDGFLSVEELKGSFDKLGFESSNVHSLFRHVTASSDHRNGHVSQDDFLLLYHGLSCKHCVSHNTSNHDNKDAKNEDDDDAEDLIWDAFNVFDKDRDGFISPMELQSVLCSLGFGAARELDACIDMIRGYDQDGDGQVDFGEFKDMLNSAIKRN